jgi:hypothetical protein
VVLFKHFRFAPTRHSREHRQAPLGKSTYAPQQMSAYSIRRIAYYRSQGAALEAADNATRAHVWITTQFSPCRRRQAAGASNPDRLDNALKLAATKARVRAWSKVRNA